MSTQSKTFLTPEQYLEIERKADFKSEYYQGEMFARSGAQLPHIRVVRNAMRHLAINWQASLANRFRTISVSAYNLRASIPTRISQLFAANRKC